MFFSLIIGVFTISLRAAADSLIPVDEEGFSRAVCDLDWGGSFPMDTLDCALFGMLVMCECAWAARPNHKDKYVNLV